MCLFLKHWILHNVFESLMTTYIPFGHVVSHSKLFGIVKPGQDNSALRGQVVDFQRKSRWVSRPPVGSWRPGLGICSWCRYGQKSKKTKEASTIEYYTMDIMSHLWISFCIQCTTIPACLAKPGACKTELAAHTGAYINIYIYYR